MAEPILKAVLKAVAAAFIEKTSIDESLPAGEGRAGKAVSTWYEHASAGEHATSGHAAAEMHASSRNSAGGVVRQGWPPNGKFRFKHGRGEAAEEFAFHD